MNEPSIHDIATSRTPSYDQLLVAAFIAAGYESSMDVIIGTEDISHHESRVVAVSTNDFRTVAVASIVQSDEVGRYEVSILRPDGRNSTPIAWRSINSGGQPGRALSAWIAAIIAPPSVATPQQTDDALTKQLLRVAADLNDEGRDVPLVDWAAGTPRAEYLRGQIELIANVTGIDKEHVNSLVKATLLSMHFEEASND